MNSTAQSNSTGALLCSNDGRRSSQELYIKFFVIHFTTLGFFFHLARRRDGKYLGWGWALYILAPLNLVFRYLLGLVVILGFYVYKVLRGYIKRDKQSVPIETLHTPLRWLLGKAPDQGYAPIPADEHHNRGGTEKLAKSIGKACVTCAFLVQCAGSIFLYHRRKQRDAVILVDQRVFELACGGLIIGILTLGLSFEIPILSEPVPDDEKTGMDIFALFCRDSCFQPLLAFDVEHEHWLRFSKNIGISFFILIVSHDSDMFAVFSNISQQLLLDTENRSNLIIFGAFFVPPICCVVFYLPFSIYKEEREHGRSSFLTRRPFMRWIIGPVCSILTPLWMLGGGVYLLPGMILTFAFWVLAWPTALKQVLELSAAPPDIACPMMWSDPLSQYIWWLA